MSSAGAVFSLVLRDDRFDKIFTASDALRQRLVKIRAKREEMGEQIVQPTFGDIDRSHVMFVRGQYRPYVATASEYTKVKASGDGAAFLGHAGGSIQFAFPIYGHFTSDMAIRVRFAAVGTENPVFTGSPASTTAPLLRYCAFPGLRMFPLISCQSDSVTLDDYTRDEAVKRMKFFTRTDARPGWARCHGQQEIKEAAFETVGVGNTSAYTDYMLYSDGPQTPKYFQPAFEMMVPLQFDFCSSPERALLNDLIPNTQRVIVAQIAPLSEILEAVQLVTTGAGIPVAQYVPIPLPFTRLKVDVELYVNELYVNPEIHDVFASRIGFSLIRVHRRQTTRLQAGDGAILLDQLKFPAEFFMVGFRNRVNLTSFDYWWLMGTPPPSNDNNRLLAPAMIWNSQINTCQLVCREARPVVTLDSIVDTVGLTAHGIEIYALSPNVFYNAYLPIRYFESTQIVSPIDTNELLVPLCLLPGRFQPSGHYNLSAGREMYINYRLTPGASELVAGQTEASISGSFLNFVVRRGDSLALRYSL